MRGKRGELSIHWETIIYWLIAFVVLGIILFAIFFLTGRGTSAIEYIKNLIRFGR
jgi:hypothetical protein